MNTLQLSSPSASEISRRLSDVIEGISQQEGVELFAQYGKVRQAARVIVEMSAFFSAITMKERVRFKLLMNTDAVLKLYEGDQGKSLLNEAFLRRLTSLSAETTKVVLRTLGMLSTPQMKEAYVASCANGQYRRPVEQVQKLIALCTWWRRPIVLRRDAAILPQLKCAITQPLILRYTLEFAGEEGKGVGVRREALALAASEIRTYFAPLFQENDKGELTFTSSEIKDLSPLFLGTILSWMIALSVPLPKRLVFAQDLFNDLFGFTSEELQGDFRGILDQCLYRLETALRTFSRFHPQKTLAELKAVFGVETDEEVHLNLIPYIQQKEVAFEVAQGLSCYGKLELGPLFAQALMPPGSLKEILADKSCFVWEDVQGDAQQLQAAFEQWKRAGTEEQLEQFMVATTSLRMLPDGKRITLMTQGATDDNIALPRSSTCTCTFYFPSLQKGASNYVSIPHDCKVVNFNDPTVFGTWMNWAVEALQEGFGVE